MSRKKAYRNIKVYDLVGKGGKDIGKAEAILARLGCREDKVALSFFGAAENGLILAGLLFWAKDGVVDCRLLSAAMHDVPSAFPQRSVPVEDQDNALSKSPPLCTAK